jgi:hypothetical protein
LKPRSRATSPLGYKMRGPSMRSLRTIGPRPSARSRAVVGTLDKALPADVTRENFRPRQSVFAPPEAKWRRMGVRGVHEALGIYTHDVHPPTQHAHAPTARPPLAGVASSGGRASASSAAACPSLGGRTPTSFTTARRPRTRTAERLLAGPDGRCGRLTQPARCMHAPPGRRASVVCARAGHARRQACERRAAGWRVPAEPTGADSFLPEIYLSIYLESFSPTPGSSARRCSRVITHARGAAHPWCAAGYDPRARVRAVPASSP